MSRRAPRISHSSRGQGLRPDAREVDWRPWIALLWLAGFVVYFFSSVLPNNPQFSRLDLLLYLPDYFAGFFEKPPPGAPASGWRFFPQRIDLIAVGGFIAATAVCVGRLALRTVGLPDRLPAHERFVLAAGVGYSAWSLLTLVLGLCGVLLRPAFLVAAFVAIAVEATFSFQDWTQRPRENGARGAADRWKMGTLAAIAPFALAMALGAMLPDSDFDVREYHLQGPKEYFQLGRIRFLPHNVYTDFPFLTEMLSLSAMVIRGDWYRGALAGKLVLMSFAPLTAVAVYSLAKRIGGAAAGWLGAFIHLSTPWTYRISIIAYAEGGLSFYLAATTLSGFWILDAIHGSSESPTTPPATATAIIAGFLAGSAMACKYTGLVSVVVPMGVAVTFLTATSHSVSRRDLIRAVAFLALGVLCAIGPWLLKNLIATGNPVSPLAWSLFGGRDWDAAMNAQWRAAHSPADFDLLRLGFWITDVSARNDWLSPLLYGFAPIAAFAAHGRRAIGALWLLVGYLFLTWWLLTHRLDRFWVPMLPIVAAVAGIGGTTISTRGWTWLRNGVLLVGGLFNLCVVTSPLSGPNGYLTDLEAARPQVAGPVITMINNRLPQGSKLLCVGEAGVFDFTVPVVYNTVFDRSIFQQWFGEPLNDASNASWRLRPADEIRRKLRSEGVTHLLVNWAEILRYRASYGYAEFVTPERLKELVALGILGEPELLSVQPLPADPKTASELDRWGESLKGGTIPSPNGAVASWRTQWLCPVLLE